jgi:hypothetical protein
MAPARRDHQKRLAGRVPALGRAIKQERPDLVRAFGAAGLAGGDRRYAGTR